MVLIPACREWNCPKGLQCRDSQQLVIRWAGTAEGLLSVQHRPLSLASARGFDHVALQSCSRVAEAAGHAVTKDASPVPFLAQRPELHLANHALKVKNWLRSSALMRPATPPTPLIKTTEHHKSIIVCHLECTRSQALDTGQPSRTSQAASILLSPDTGPQKAPCKQELHLLSHLMRRAEHWPVSSRLG